MSTNIKLQKLNYLRWYSQEGICFSRVGTFALAETALRIAVKVEKRSAPILAGNATKHFVNKKINKLNKKFTKS